MAVVNRSFVHSCLLLLLLAQTCSPSFVRPFRPFLYFFDSSTEKQSCVRVRGCGRKTF